MKPSPGAIVWNSGCRGVVALEGVGAVDAAV